jgi:LytS/YehU family sensor histidine kinase
MSRRPLLLATLAGTVLQVAMVVAGHTSPTIKGLFAVGGMGLSLLAGALYASLARPISKGGAASGGAIAGALCGFLGILVSYYLGDVPASLLALGTISSGVTGAIGGLIAALAGGRSKRAAAGMVLLLSLSTRDAAAQHTVSTADMPRVESAGNPAVMELTDHRARRGVRLLTTRYDVPLPLLTTTYGEW